MKNRLSYWIIPLLALTLAGCSVEKPTDASDPKSSVAWMKSSLKKVGRNSAEAQIKILQDVYLHAEAMPTEELPTELATQIDRIPKQIYALSMQTKELDAFLWATERGVKIDSHYDSLLAYWNLGPAWRDFILSNFPDAALPVFMNQAVEGYNVKFFTQYAGAFKATGYTVKSPLETTDFNVRFCRFIGEQIEDALKADDRECIEFLIEHTPKLSTVVYIDWKMKESMQALGDYVFYELKDEALACKVIELGYDLNRIDLDKVEFGPSFTDALRANPEHTVRVLELSEWNGALSESTTDFLLTLPPDALGSIHKLYLDETLKACIENGNDEEIMQLIQLREKKNPPTLAAYTELMNWALEYGNQTVFDYVMEHCTELDIFHIDFALLANNQTLFVQYAPTIMKRVYYTMDNYPKKDGTTIGRIYDVFANDNEQAGLYLVRNYNLSAAWVKATKGRTLLMDVCHAGNLQAAGFLIEKRGADLHSETGYSELEITIFGRNHPTEGKLSSIFFAAKSGNADLIKYLKSKGANINARSNFGTTPLMHAVTGNHLEATQMLIALRANVNTQMNPSINQVDLRSVGSYDEISNAYRRARANGNEAILNALKKAGARP